METLSGSFHGTVLQLESEILAELYFPSSGLPALELVPYNIPDWNVARENVPGMPESVNTHQTVVLFHSARTFLCTRLNNSHGEICGSQKSDMNAMQTEEMLRGHDLVLTQWRKQSVHALRREYNNQPSLNILHARL